MEAMLSRLLKDYEEGKVGRRELIRALAGVAGAAAVSLSPRDGHAAGGFKAVALDHLSYQVQDYRRTRDFYSDLLGMKVESDNDENQCSLTFGDASLIARNHREASTSGSVVDHVAYKIDDWDTDTVRTELERRGLSPRLDNPGGGSYVSFLVEDPDGFTVQISGDVQPGDSMYKG